MNAVRTLFLDRACEVGGECVVTEQDQERRGEEVKRSDSQRAAGSAPEQGPPTGQDSHASSVGSRSGARLRARAEELVSGALPEGAPLTELEVKGIVHELQVHRIELEIQNEELRHAQVDLAASLERYADLYEYAPVGYLSVGLDGLITRANLAAADLLMMERHRLTGRGFSRFISPEDMARFQAMRRRLVIPGLSESVELLVRPFVGEPFWARLEVITRQDASEGAIVWQVAISNVDAQKRAEMTLQRLKEELEEQVHTRTEQLAVTNRHLLEEVTRRRDAEAELRQRKERLEQRVAERTTELATLLSVARDMTSTLDIDSVLESILSALQVVVPYTGCGIFLLQGQVLTLVAYNGPLERDGLVQSQINLGDSPWLQNVVQGRRPLLIPDLLTDSPLTKQWQRNAGALQRHLMSRSRCWLGVPMIAQGKAVGVLRLDHLAAGFFTEQHADLVFTLASQAAIAVINARLFEQVQRVAAVEERQRLARELHDSVAQTFYSIALAAHSAKAHLDEDAEPATRRLDHILELSEAGLTEMKALIFDLQAEGLRRDGLVRALRHHVEAISARHDVRVEVDLGEEPQATIEAKEAVYGIAREALQNVVRHAAAGELSLLLTRATGSLCVEVRDNGKGFSPDTVGMQTLGLRSMRERADAVGGSVEISSAPGQGTVVRACIPAGSPSAAGPGADAP